MTTKHKMIWSIRAILVVVLLIEIGMYWQLKQAEKYADEIGQMSIDLGKDLDVLQQKLESMLAKADSRIMKNYGHLPMPTNNVKSTYHDSYEDALIQDVDKKRGLVLVTTIDSKMDITFKPSADNLEKFHAHIGWIAPVTFQCTKKKKGRCDFSSPYKLFVSNGLVEMKEIKFPMF